MGAYGPLLIAPAVGLVALWAPSMGSSTIEIMFNLFYMMLIMG